jgi:hypothetical protein
VNTRRRVVVIKALKQYCLFFSQGIYGRVLFCSTNQSPVEAAMLAEKFFLVLETLRNHASDGSVKVISTASHVPSQCAAVPKVEDSDEWRERRKV